MIDRICEKSKCTACFACLNVCPVNAITIKPDAFGSAYPVIANNCTECGLCKKTCPSNSPLELKKPLSACAVFSRDKKTRNASTSGGMIFTAAKEFDGVVYGAAYSGDLNVECMRFENKDNLYKTQSSKYVHSFINHQFRNVKKDLENGKRVLFTGTPCQVAGLKNYLKKDYKGLYTVDFVCHGVSDREHLKAFIKNEFPSLDFKKAAVRFRDGKGYHMTVWEGEDYKGELPFNQNFYFHGFLEGWSLRENCHICPYASINRCSDLTACDCWGSKNESIMREMKNGLSGVLVNTEKGRELLESVKPSCEIIQSSVDEAQSGIAHLKAPSPVTDYSRRFHSLNKKRGAYFAFKNTVLKKKIVFKLRKIKNAGNSNN